MGIFRKTALNKKMKRWRLAFILFIISAGAVNAQGTGSITGTIVDAETGEKLIGVNILIVNTTNGTSSDLEGEYILKGLPSGSYALKFSYVSYAPVTVNDITIKENQTTKVDVQLHTETTELNEVVVSAEMLTSNENAMLKIQKNSLNIMDAVSAELISKNNSSDGADVLKRMTGVTISEGKYAYIRGVSDRYNNTTLNGASLPGTDPEKKSFSYDIIPSSMIENVITAKTFTPDKPADFTGGLVQITTVEFPSKFTFNISSSSSYKLETTGESYTSYDGGKYDFLGIDDGTRDMPSIIPDTKLSSSDRQYSAEIAKSFKNNWDAQPAGSAPINSSFQLSVGDRYEFSNSTLGAIASLNYSNNYNIENYKIGSFTFDETRYTYEGHKYNNGILWGALFNLSYKFLDNHKISIKNTYNQTTDNDVVINEGFYGYTGQYRKTTALNFIERSLLSIQLTGEHAFPKFYGSSINWVANFGRSSREEPDGRRYAYWRDDINSPYRFLLDQSITTRLYSKLDDDILGGSLDYTIKPFENKNLPDFKIGVLYDKRDREFDARLFGFRNLPGGAFMAEDSTLQSASVNEIFKPEHIGNQFIDIVEITRPSDSYDSKQEITSGYLMTNFQLLSDIKFVMGARYEYSVQKLNSQSITNQTVSVDHEYNDVLPSLNVIYTPLDKLTMRIGYNKTLARPEFRELAPYQYSDFITGETIQGNPELTRSLIDNYDLRLEYYQNLGEIFAVSFFYKHYRDGIEQVLEPQSSFEAKKTYKNATSSKSYGLEFEVKKSLGNITDFLSDFSFVGNVSLIKSEVDLTDQISSGYTASKRPLQGQADYIINLGLYYDYSDAGLAASLVYNKVGQKINTVGVQNYGDIIEMPRDQVDFSVSKNLFTHFNLKLTAKDILAQDHLFLQRHPDGDKVAKLYPEHQSFSVGISYKIN